MTLEVIRRFRAFQMQSVEHLCSILHEFNWQCARGPSMLAELPHMNRETRGKKIVYARNTESG